MKKLIQQISNLNTSEEYKFTQGFSGVDISTPIVIEDILFRKTQRCINEPTEPAILPFELNSYIQGAEFYAYKQTYIKLGVLLFELLFSNQSYLELKIPYKNSNIRQFFIYLNRTNVHNPLLEVENLESYSSYKYYPKKIEKFPFTNINNKCLPCFYLNCNDQKFEFTEYRVAKSDQLIMELSVNSLINCAELLLNIGNKQNTQTEIWLENPLYGLGGVQEKSMEICFWLPNSFGFYTDDIRDLRFE